MKIFFLVSINFSTKKIWERILVSVWHTELRLSEEQFNNGTVLDINYQSQPFQYLTHHFKWAHLLTQYKLAVRRPFEN